MRTEHGIGILLNKETNHNGLYYEKGRTQWLVWYGTNNPNRRSPWISCHYHHTEIRVLTASERREFLASLPDHLLRVVKQ